MSDHFTNKSESNSSEIDVAAQPVETYGRLTQEQKKTVWRILLRVYEISEAEAQLRLSTKSSKDDLYTREQYNRRPQHVFLIDGARGSGKTTLMLTIRRHLGYLGRPSRLAASENEKPRKFIKELKADNNSDYQLLENVLGQPFDFDNLFTCDHEGPSGKRFSTACTLNALFPSDLESSQPLMEGVFAHMAEKISAKLKEIEKTDCPDEKQRKRLEELRKKLQVEVVSGWYLSRAEGQEALLRDSLNFNEYMEKRGDRSGQSFKRVSGWRDFVNKFLDELSYQTLAVFIDDTDVKPEATADMLNTIRVFLDHPRIVTVLAGNVRTMRNSLVHTELRQLTSSIHSLSRPDDPDADDWRRSTRQHVEEYLDKVLPRYNRYFLRIKPEPLEKRHQEKKSKNIHHGEDAATGCSTPPSDDVENIIGVNFRQLCRDQLKRHEADYTEMRIRQALGGPFTPTETTTRHLAAIRGGDDRSSQTWAGIENYLAWWLYLTAYGAELRPRSIRQLHALDRFTRPASKSKVRSGDAPPSAALPGGHRKRLAVVLFDSPDNFSLTHRFGDNDDDVISWIRRQNIRSNWLAERYYELNGRRLFCGGYSYDYISFIIDLAIAKPLPHGHQKLAPRNLLPMPGGSNLLGFPPFYNQPERQQPRYGVSNSIRHSVIPSNCFYFSDLEYIPEVAWIQDDERSQSFWGNNLIYEWRQVFETERDRREPFNERTGLDSASPDRVTLASIHGPSTGSVQDRFNSESIELVNFPSSGTIEKYWENVVISLGSLDLIQFQRPPEDADDKPPLIQSEIKNHFFDDSISRIESLRRNFDYYEHFSKFGTLPKEQSEAVLRNSARLIFKPLLGRGDRPEEMAALRPHLADYCWLITHVRRAWHAGRIFAGQVQSADRINRNTYRLRSEILEKQDRYVIPSRRLLLEFAKTVSDQSVFRDRTETARQSGNRASYNWAATQRKAVAPLELSPALSLKKKARPLTNDVFRLSQKWSDVSAIMFAHELLRGDIDIHKNNKNDKVNPESLLNALETENYADREEISVAGLRKNSCSGAALIGLALKEDEQWRHRIGGLLMCRELPQLPDDERATIDTTRMQHALFERAFVLFIWAVAPSLPALMHLEIAAYCRRAWRTKIKNAEVTQEKPEQEGSEGKETPEALLRRARCALRSWRVVINWLHRYSLRSRALAEADLILLTVKAGLTKHEDKEQKTEQPIFAPRFPDIAIETLGVAGPAAFCLQLIEEAKDTPHAMPSIAKTLDNIIRWRREEQEREAGKSNGDRGEKSRDALISAALDRGEPDEATDYKEGVRDWNGTSGDAGIFPDTEAHLEAAMTFAGELWDQIDNAAARWGLTLDPDDPKKT